LAGSLQDSSRSDPDAATRALTEKERSSIAEDAPKLSRGDAFDRYVVLEELGAGGMGVVYGAYDPNLDRRVALKLLNAQPSESTGATDAAARLFREAQAMAKLSHPNVVHVYDVGKVDKHVFIAAEYVEGATLREWLAERPRSWREVLDVFVPAGRGLAAAHAVGLVHRDFKPLNVMVGDDGRVQVTDFGLARLAGRGDEDGPTPLASPTVVDLPEALLTSPLTVDGTVMGTPKYMAPEQLQGLAVDAKADQFSYCVALYEALYQEHPFADRAGKTAADTLAVGKVRAAPRDSQVPAWLRRVLLRGLSMTPASRWPGMDALLAALGKDPRRKWRIAGVAALVLAVVGAGGMLYGQYERQQAQVCAGAEQKLSGAWDEARKRAVRDSILGTGVSYAEDTWPRVENLLDLYTGRWVAMHREACEATQIKREQSEATMDLRMACLDKRMLELRGLVKVLADADREVVARAVDAASALTPIERCADTEALRSAVPPPDDPEVERRVEAIRERMAEGQAMYAAGRHAAGLELAEGLVREARELGYEPLLAEALFLKGKHQARAAQIEEAAKSIAEAGFLAEANRADELAAEAQTMMVFVVGQQAGRVEEGLAWAKHARAAVARAGGLGEGLEATLLSYLGMIHAARGDFEEALADARRSVELEEKVLGPDDPRRASALNSLGAILLWTEDIEGAREAFEQCLALEERAHGPRNPRVGHVLNNIGVLYMGDKDYEAAKPVLERALKIVEDSLGPEHPAVASPLNNLGRILTEEGKWKAAHEHLERALAIWEKALGPDHPSVAEAYDNLAYYYGKREQYDQALVSAQRGLEILQKAYGEGDASTSGSLGQVAEALLAVGRRKEALEAAERSHDLATKDPGKTTRLPNAEFRLARVLWETSRDTERARKLAAKARDGYAKLERTTDVGEVEKWLEEH